MNPAVSVIVPTHGRGELLQSAVGSVLAQTYSDFEVIVVDDASDPPVDAVLPDDPRLRYLRRDVQGGGGAARNTGIQAARGDFVAFLDSDDLWLPPKLEVYLQDLVDRSAEYAVGAVRRTDEQGGDELLELPESRLRVPQVLMHPVSGAGSTLIVRRALLDTVGRFDPCLRRHQDWDLMVRLAHDGRFAIVTEPLVLVRRTGLPPLDAVIEAKRLFMTKHRDLISSQPFSVRRRIVSVHLRDVAEHALAQGARLTAVKWWFAALARHPRAAGGFATDLFDDLFT